MTKPKRELRITPTPEDEKYRPPAWREESLAKGMFFLNRAPISAYIFTDDAGQAELLVRTWNVDYHATFAADDAMIASANDALIAAIEAYVGDLARLVANLKTEVA